MQPNKALNMLMVLKQSDSTITVYYDGDCPVCSREIAAYRRQAGAERCVWVDASSCLESELGTGLSRDKALARFHIRRANGVLVDGMRGFTVLWRTLPRFAWAGRIASIGPMPLLLDGAYSVFLRIRPLWQGPRAISTSKERP
jgi:predicted DCC family thiol-disulfide oxidoreductase YuxK